jgi:hypothetical protein
LNGNRYTRGNKRRGGNTVLVFEVVGMVLFALFFGALITNKESISR